MIDSAEITEAIVGLQLGAAAIGENNKYNLGGWNFL